YDFGEVRLAGDGFSRGHEMAQGRNGCGSRPENFLHPMEIHQLRYFVAVAEERSFSRAAAREHVAQPSMSQQIQKLEGDVGERLFDRLPRSVVLTEAGNCLLDYARKVLLEMTNARRCVEDLKREVAGRLTVGAILTIAPYVL